MYGLTGYQEEIVNVIQTGLANVAHHDWAIATLEKIIKVKESNALSEAEGSNEATRKANAAKALAEDEDYAKHVVDCLDDKRKRDENLAVVEAAKVAARFITATIAAGSPS